MTVPCTSCGEPLDEDDIRCRMCGTLAPPLPGTSVFADDTVIDPGDEVASDREDATRVEPWAIPIREPRLPEAVLAPDRSDLVRTVTYAVVAVAVLAGVVGLSVGVLTGGGGADELAGTAASDVDEEDELSTDATTTSSAPTSTSTSTTSSTTSTSSTSTTTTTAPTSGASVPTLSSSFRSGWVAQLTSVPASAGAASLESAFTTVRSDAPGAVATRSDEWPSLQSGYWVIVAPGPFGSEDQVRSFCSSIGRSTDGCLPRMLADRR